MKKCRRIFVMAAVLLTVFLLFGCCLSHQWQESSCAAPKACAKCGETEGEALEHSWQEATCENPETCSLCGETKREALGHTEGETEVASVDSVHAIRTLECHCQRCGEVMSTREENMPALYEGQMFLMSPQEFVHRLNMAFDSIPGPPLRAERISNNGMIVITISSGNDNVGHFVLYNSNYKDTDKYMISRELADTHGCYDFAMGGIQPDSEVCLSLIVATVMACDPTMDLDKNSDSLAEAVSGILTGSSYECNGITYAFLDYIDEDYWILMLGFGELL